MTRLLPDARDVADLLRIEQEETAAALEDYRNTCRECGQRTDDHARDCTVLAENEATRADDLREMAGGDE
jgi:hypothetical protein